METKRVDPVVTAHKRVSNQKILDAVDSIHNEKIETIRTWSFRQKKSLRKSDFSYIGDCENDVALRETVKRKETGGDGMGKRKGQVKGVVLVGPQGGDIKHRVRIKGHFKGQFL